MHDGYAIAKNVEKVFGGEEGRKRLEALGRDMANNAHWVTAEGNVNGAQWLLTSLASLPSLPPDMQDIVREVFQQHSSGKTFEEVLLDVLPLLERLIAYNAYQAPHVDDDYSETILFSLTSLRTLITHYRLLAGKERVKDELRTSKKETTEPIIPPKNF